MRVIHRLVLIGLLSLALGLASSPAVQAHGVTQLHQSHALMTRSPRLARDLRLISRRLESHFAHATRARSRHARRVETGFCLVLCAPPMRMMD